MRHFSPAELREYLQHADDPPLLIDVREEWEYNICQFSGSCLLPMKQLLQDPEQLDKNREIVLVCHHGIRSCQLARVLEHIGCYRVINLDGGPERWTQDLNPGMAPLLSISLPVQSGFDRVKACIIHNIMNALQGKKEYSLCVKF